MKGQIPRSCVILICCCRFPLKCRWFCCCRGSALITLRRKQKLRWRIRLHQHIQVIHTETQVTQVRAIQTVAFSCWTRLKRRLRTQSSHRYVRKPQKCDSDAASRQVTPDPSAQSSAAVCLQRRAAFWTISRYQFIGEEHPRGDRLKMKASHYNGARRTSVTAPEQLSNDTFQAKFPGISWC